MRARMSHEDGRTVWEFWDKGHLLPSEGIWEQAIYWEHAQDCMQGSKVSGRAWPTRAGQWCKQGLSKAQSYDTHASSNHLAARPDVTVRPDGQWLSWDLISAQAISGADVKVMTDH